MLQFGRDLRDHMLKGDFPDYVSNDFDDYYNRAFAGMTLDEFDDFVTQITQEIGRRPVLSFGNSSGDVSMHNYTLSDNPYKSMAFMLVADDNERDYGEEGEEKRERWEKSGYQVISMANDRKTIYGSGVEKSGSFHWMEDLSEK